MFWVNLILPFTLFKFRTLKKEPVANESAFVEEGDDRVLIAGRFMRRWRIDELPQLINVLRGEMSIAGPRPERPKIAESLEREIPFYAFRYSVRPGITGWAQVNGRNALSWEDKFALDVWYVDNQSLWLDTKILFMTLIKVVKRDGVSQEGHVTMEPFRGSQD